MKKLEGMGVGWVAWVWGEVKGAGRDMGAGGWPTKQTNKSASLNHFTNTLNLTPISTYINECVNE